MNEIWNEICFELKACIQNNVLEKEYENAESTSVLLFCSQICRVTMLLNEGVSK